MDNQNIGFGDRNDEELYKDERTFDYNGTCTKTHSVGLSILRNTLI